MPLDPVAVSEGTRFTMSGWNDPESGSPMVHAVQGIGKGLASHFATCPNADQHRNPRPRTDG